MIFFTLLGIIVLNDTQNVLTLKTAYSALSSIANTSDEGYFFEGFENHPNAANPWGGYQPWNWLVFESFANSGQKGLQGISNREDDTTYTISPRFEVPANDPSVIVESFLKVTGDGSTWQFVPQGEGFVTARMIIFPNGQVGVFDATTGENPLRLPFFFELNGGAPFVKCTFVIERLRNRYHLFLNDQRFHTGTPFTTDLRHVVFDCDLAEEGFVMAIDDVSVRPLNANVPTLQTWALFALCSLLVAAAVWQRRRFGTRVPH